MPSAGIPADGFNVTVVSPTQLIFPFHGIDNIVFIALSTTIDLKGNDDYYCLGYVATCPFPREIQRCEGCVGREAELQQLRQAFTCKRTPDKPAVQVNINH